MSTDPPKIIPFGNPPRKRLLSLIERLKLDAPRTPEDQIRLEEFMERAVKDLSKKLLGPHLHEEQLSDVQFANLKNLYQAKQEEDIFFRKGESQIKRIGDIEYEQISEHRVKYQLIVTDINFRLDGKVEIKSVYEEPKDSGSIEIDVSVLSDLYELKDTFSIAVGGDEENRNRLRNIVEPLFEEDILKLEP